MRLDELKKHCLKTLKQTEKFPTKTFEEHVLVLRLIENQTSVIEELEKIKAEIEQMDFDFGNYYDNSDLIIEKVSNVIDKHIAELKGEKE